MAVINIGNEAIDRAGGMGIDGRTVVNKGGPANASGIITSIELWAGAALNNVKFATFFVESGNNLSTRDTHTHIGIIPIGSKQTISGLNLAVEVGDFIGIQATHGSLERDSSGLVGLWYVNSYFIPCTDEIFTLVANWGVSLKGIGVSDEPEGGNALMMGTNF